MADLSVDWFDEARTIIRVVCPVLCDWQVGQQAQQSINTLLDEVEHPVHIIVDTSQMETFIQNVTWNLRRLLEEVHVNWSRVVLVIGLNPRNQIALRVAVRVIGQLYLKEVQQMTFLFASTQAEALQLLQDHTHSPPDDLPDSPPDFSSDSPPDSPSG